MFIESEIIKGFKRLFNMYKLDDHFYFLGCKKGSKHLDQPQL